MNYPNKKVITFEKIVTKIMCGELLLSECCNYLNAFITSAFKL